MPAVRREHSAFYAWAWLAIAIIVVVWMGPGLFQFALIIGLAYIYPTFVHLMRWLVRGRALELEGNQLTIRSRHGAIVGRIDLNANYEAECEYHGSDRFGLDAGGSPRTWGLYKVKQGQNRYWFTSEAQGAPEILRQKLGIAWPPVDKGVWRG